MDIALAEPAPPRPVSLIVIHCSATASGQWLRRGKPADAGYQSAAALIDGWHAERGFARRPEAARVYNPELPHIGYHRVIDLDGTVFTGRSVNEAGAHAKGFNAHSVGICLVGGVEPVGRYTPAQWKALKTQVLALGYKFRIAAMPPRPNGSQLLEGVCGHRDLSPDTNQDGAVSPNEWLKTCPGFDVKAWLRNKLDPLDAHIFRGKV